MMPTSVRFITVGSLKESYLREAAAEYKKRLSGLCRVEEIELKEVRLPDDPSDAEIKKALSEEAKAILAAIPPRAYPIAMCVEGTQMSSPKLAEKLASRRAGLERQTRMLKCCGMPVCSLKTATSRF